MHLNNSITTNNSHTIVRTDHTAVKYIKEKDSNTRPRGRIALWILELQGYEFEIQYRPGKSNAAADALSHLPSYPPSTETQTHISGTSIIMTTDFMDSDNAFDNVNKQNQHNEPQLEKFEWREAQLFETETLPLTNIVLTCLSSIYQQSNKIVL